MDEIYDFVVVGSGGGSMCAALVLRKGGKSVLILEKTDQVGGSTSKSGGVMWIPNNRFMKAAGIEDSFEKAVAYLDATVGIHPDSPGATPERRQTYVREAAAMVDFLVNHGIKLRRSPYWPDYHDNRPGGSEAGRTVVADLFDVKELGVWKHKLREGVEFRLNAGVKEVILKDGAVKGVLATIDGQESRIDARLGVLLNAGGFAQNQDMRDRYVPNTRTEWSHAAPGDTGDMHREMMRIGAAMAQMDEMVGNQMTVPPGTGPAMIQPQIAKPHAFLVDQSGVRYMNEAGSYMEFCQRMLARDREVPAIPSWMIMDHRYLSDYMLADTMPGPGKPRRWFDEKYLRKGGTIAELALACGIDPARLEATTVRFNELARTGRDEDFQRGDRAYDRFLGDRTHSPSPSLGPVEQGPFYAVPVVPGDVGTFGGVITDCDARVLREDGSVIPGLYATGTTTASCMGRAYPGAGCSIGPSFTWGYVAAKHAAHLGNQTPV